MSAVSSPIRAFLIALTLSVLATPAGAARRDFVSGTASDPQICGDTPASVTCVAATAPAHPGQFAAAAATTHTAVRAKHAHRHHRLHRAHARLAAETLRAGAHPASSPAPAHPARSAPAHRAPAPASPRYDGGKTAQNRYRSLQGAAAFSPPAALTRTEAALQLAAHSDVLVLCPQRVEEGRGPPRAGPSSTFAAVPVPSRRTAPHRTASSPVPPAPDDLLDFSARPSRAPFAFAVDLPHATVPPFACAGSATAPHRCLKRAFPRPGVRRPEGTAPQFHSPPSNLGGLT